MGFNIKELFKGAKETVTNYVSAYSGNTAERLGSTLEDKQYALKFGPVGSLAYNTALSNRYLVKNPSSIAFIGSAGKVGVAAKSGSTAAKIVQTAQKAAQPAIKNLPGFVQTTVNKAVSQAVANLPKQQAGGLFSSTFGKVLAVGGLVTGGALAITNSLDFYNWNGPIQNILRNKFPWLYQASLTPAKTKEKPEIKRLTPDETRQLQELIYQQTGQRLTGEELRRAIFDKFGITVLEYKERAGDVPGPLSGGDVKGFISSIRKSNSKLTINAQPQLMINNAQELQDATMNEISAFIQALPGRMSFDYIIKATYVDADGKRRKGNFAVVKVSIINKRGTKTEVAELPLGTVPGNIGTPTPLDGANVAKQITNALKSAVSVPVAQTNLAAAPSPASSKPLVRVGKDQFFRIHGDPDVYQRRGSGISKYGPDQTLPPDLPAELPVLSPDEVEIVWRDILNKGSDRYDIFRNDYNNPERKILRKKDIQAYLGRKPTGGLPTRGDELITRLGTK